MIEIDKKMLEDLKKWWHRDRPKYQYILYVNSKDRMLTDKTIRKLMYQIYEEDEYGEEYVSFFSAKNFIRNMREYFSHIAELYRCDPGEDDPIEDIISSIPPTGGWLTLIVEDLEELSEQPEQMITLFQAVFAFVAKRASVILIGSGDHRRVLSRSESLLSDIEYLLHVKEKEKRLMFGLYEQDEDPDTEVIDYDQSSDKRSELDHYWHILYSQIGYKYFDYVYFKILFEETLRYLIPRITIEHVYRQDIQMIEKIAKFRPSDSLEMDGCEPWELDSAKEFAQGFNTALIDPCERKKDLSAGMLLFYSCLAGPERASENVVIRSRRMIVTEVHPDDLSAKMDKLAEAIHLLTYEGKYSEAMELIYTDGYNDTDQENLN